MVNLVYSYTSFGVQMHFLLVESLREALLAPADGKLLSRSTEHVIAHQDEFEHHHYKNEATTPPSLEVSRQSGLLESVPVGCLGNN